MGPHVKPLEKLETSKEQKVPSVARESLRPSVSWEEAGKQKVSGAYRLYVLDLVFYTLPPSYFNQPLMGLK